jgi:hypothetical protein
MRTQIVTICYGLYPFSANLTCFQFFFLFVHIASVDEIHMILGAGAGGGGAMDAANLLKPMLARGELRCIGATTLEEYRKHVEAVSTTIQTHSQNDRA